MQTAEYVFGCRIILLRTQCFCKIDINSTTFMSNKTLWHYNLLRKFEYILISNHLIWGFRRENRRKIQPNQLLPGCVLKATLNTPNVWIKKCIKQGQTKPPSLFQMSDHSNGKNQGVLAISQKKYPLFWLGGS